jgi:hypothetical protein
MPPPAQANIDEKTCCRRSISSNIATDRSSCRPFGLSVDIRTSRPGSSTGSVRSTSALTRLKMALFAPMPSASDSTATAVKPGFLLSVRAANFTSCANCSTAPHPHISLLASFSGVAFPNCRIARYRASSESIPSSWFSSACIAT